MSRLLLYNAAPEFAMTGADQHLDLYLLLPTTVYEFFIIPKQRSIIDLLILKVLKGITNQLQHFIS